MSRVDLQLAEFTKIVDDLVSSVPTSLGDNVVGSRKHRHVCVTFLNPLGCGWIEPESFSYSQIPPHMLMMMEALAVSSSSSLCPM